MSSQDVQKLARSVREAGGQRGWRPDPKDVNVIMDVNFDVHGGWEEDDMGPRTYSAEGVMDLKIQIRFKMGFWATMVDFGQRHVTIQYDHRIGWMVNVRGGRLHPDHGLDTFCRDMVAEYLYQNARKVLPQG